ncbi:DUF6010 family protein [Streptomyces sp. NPDC007971]|uniref:DUF6010 family protein n=1 Tax=Streptomyces sp. NPDC007971 TaxID=3364799 RepID=UPI0036EFD918
MVPFAHDASFGCALCDPVIAAWCLEGGRSPWRRLRARAAPMSFREPAGHHDVQGSPSPRSQS